MQELLNSWEGYDGSELLEAIAREYPNASDDEKRKALDGVARGPYADKSIAAAEALCRLAGLGNPCDTASDLYNESEGELSEPQWFVYNAGAAYNWTLNSGLTACYFEFEDKEFEDRLRMYDAIGAKNAAAVLREADLAFGPDGPAGDLEGRQAAMTTELRNRLEELNPRFWECGDEIYTRTFLYALEHPEEFRVES